jgi:hypothetical protein
MFIILHMLRSLLLLLFVIVHFIFVMPVKAVEVKDLYQASVAIHSQKNQDRPAALKEALAAVMLKVGGEKSVLDNEMIKKALKNYQQYLTQYRYQQKTIRIESTSIERKSNNKQLFLLASFNADKINALFQQANLPLWGSLRPQVLLWLIDEQGLSRTIMSNSTDSALPFMVNVFSEQRGLPIMMPLMDLTDASQVSVSDVWGRFEQPIREFSTRYFAEAIAVMRISDSSLKSMDVFDADESTDEVQNCGLLCSQTEKKQTSYVLDWSLITTQQTFSKQYQGNERQALLAQGLSDITEVIYQHYALSASNEGDFILDVANVDSLSTYVKVFEFLNDLSAVNKVTLLTAKGENRRFKLQLLGSKEALLASLKLDKKLQQHIDPLADLNNESGEDIAPVFFWGVK